jgi:hypothetical protein
MLSLDYLQKAFEDFTSETSKLTDFESETEKLIKESRKLHVLQNALHAFTNVSVVNTSFTGNYMQT